MACFLNLTAAAPAPSRLQLTFEGLRSQKGQLLICAAAAPKAFPDCHGDAAQVSRLIVPVAGHATVTLDVPPGDWAVAVAHDENGNGRLDTSAGIPREGFGFTRNPRVWFGPPAYKSAAVRVDAGRTTATAIRMKYML